MGDWPRRDSRAWILGREWTWPLTAIHFGIEGRRRRPHGRRVDWPTKEQSGCCCCRPAVHLHDIHKRIKCQIGLSSKGRGGEDGPFKNGETTSLAYVPPEAENSFASILGGGPSKGRGKTINGRLTRRAECRDAPKTWWDASSKERETGESCNWLSID